MNELSSEPSEATEKATENNLNPLVVPLLLEVLKRLADVIDNKMTIDDEDQRPVFTISLVALLSTILPELDEQEGVQKVKELIPNLRNSIKDGKDSGVVAAMAKLLFQLA